MSRPKRQCLSIAVNSEGIASEEGCSDATKSKRNASRKSVSVEVTDDNIVATKAVEESSEKVVEISAKRRRGRPPKNLVVAASVTESPKQRSQRLLNSTNNSEIDFEDEDIAEEVEDEERTPRKKRGRKRVQKTDSSEASFDNSNEDDDEDDVVVKEDVVRRGRGRPRKGEKVIKTNSAKKNFAKQNEGDSASIPVNCAHCNKVLASRGKYSEHLMISHHRMLINRSTLEDVHAPQEVFNRKKQLACLKCGKKYHVFLSFAYHDKWCGVEQKKVKCELCGNEMSEVSLYSHMRAKHSTPAAAAAAKPEVDGAAAAGAGDVANVVNAEDGADESRRPKRQTAQKALQKLRASDAFVSQWNLRGHLNKSVTYVCPGGAISSELLDLCQQCIEDIGCVRCPFRDCGVKCRNQGDLTAHLGSCSKRPKVVRGKNITAFVCVTCGCQFTTEPEVKEHVVKHEDEGHSSDGGESLSLADEQDEDEEEESSGDEEEGQGDEGDGGDSDLGDVTDDEDDLGDPSKRWNGQTTRSINFKCHFQRAKAAALSRTFEERCVRDELPPLLPDLLVSWADVVTLPLRSVCNTWKTSPEFRVVVDESDIENASYSRLEPHRSALHDNDTSVLNAGNSVWSLAWCPLPHRTSLRSTQYLAVNAYHDDVTHKIDRTYTGPAYIQLWDCGQLQHCNTSTASLHPRLACVIALQCGSIAQMKWCPIGGYVSADQDGRGRLGLLLVAGRNGTLHIVSVPHIPDLGIAEVGDPVCVQLPPSSVLDLTFEGAEPSPCLCCDWQADMVTVGYGDGCVAVWSVAGGNSASLVHVFHAHLSAVRGIALEPLKRLYMTTCGQDRQMKVWRLADTEQPVCERNHGLFTSVTWPPHWPIAIATHDYSATPAKQLMMCQYLFHRQEVMLCLLVLNNTCSWCIDFSAWTNTAISCGLGGEVIMLHGQDYCACDQLKHKLVGNVETLMLTTIDQEADQSDATAGNGDQSNTIAADCGDQSNSNAGTRNKVNGVTIKDREEGAAANGGGGDSLHPKLPRQRDVGEQRITIHIARQKSGLNSKQSQNVARVDKHTLHAVAWNANFASHDWIAVGGAGGVVVVTRVAQLHSSRWRHLSQVTSRLRQRLAAD